MKIGVNDISNKKIFVFLDISSIKISRYLGKKIGRSRLSHACESKNTPAKFVL